MVDGADRRNCRLWWHRPADRAGDERTWRLSRADRIGNHRPVPRHRYSWRSAVVQLTDAYCAGLVDAGCSAAGGFHARLGLAGGGRRILSAALMMITVGVVPALGRLAARIP